MCKCNNVQVVYIINNPFLISLRLIFGICSLNLQFTLSSLNINKHSTNASLSVSMKSNHCKRVIQSILYKKKIKLLIIKVLIVYTLGM